MLETVHIKAIPVAACNSVVILLPYLGLTVNDFL